MNDFYAIKCFSCGRWSGTQLRTTIQKKIFVCKYCRKTRKLKKKREWGLTLNISGAYSVREIPKIVVHLNGKDKPLRYVTYST